MDTGGGDGGLSVKLAYALTMKSISWKNRWSCSLHLRMAGVTWRPRAEHQPTPRLYTTQTWG